MDSNIKTILIHISIVLSLVSEIPCAQAGVGAMSSFVITNTNDNGAGSLRDAILQANAAPGADVIIFDTSEGSPFDDDIPDTISLSTGQLTISDDLTIVGPEEDKLTVNALQNSRVFNVDDGNAGNFINVEIQNIKITGGSVVGFLIGGGGIANYENLTLTNCTVSGNTVNETTAGGAGIWNRGGILTINDSKIQNNISRAVTDDGGGISNYQGATTINNSLISGNHAVQVGGGVYSYQGTLEISNTVIEKNECLTNGTGGGVANTGTAILRNTVIRDNTALDLSQASVYGLGGGIYNAGSMTLIESEISGNRIGAGTGEVVLGGGLVNVSTLTSISSTISGNTAFDADTILHLGEGFYGGIYNGGTMSLINSTISGNAAEDGVGAIVNYSGNLNLINSTVNNNTDQGVLVAVGGIYNYNGSITLANSIIANSQGGADFANTGGTVLLHGANLVEDGSVAGVLTGDPILSALQDNGGPTLTHAPQPGSPVIDAGANNALPADTFDLDGDGNTTEPIPFDQRGLGFPRIAAGSVDLGAVEFSQSEQDTDGDGIGDSSDNCILVANGPIIPDAGGNSQLDTDEDGYGNICDPDFDNNGIVNAADLAYMKTKFFSTEPDADLDGSGVVNAADLAILKQMFFGPPGPSGLVP